MQCKITFIKGRVPVGRCGLAWIGSHTNHQGVSGYWEQNIKISRMECSKVNLIVG